MRKDERFMIRRNNGGLGPELFLRIIKEIAEVPVGEVHLGAAGGIDAQSHLAVGEDFSEMIVVAGVVEMSAGRDLLDQVSLRIANHTVVVVQPGLAAMVDLSRTKLAQGLVRSHVITLVLPAVKAALLGRESRRRRLSGLGLQISVAAFMGAIFLR